MNRAHVLLGLAISATAAVTSACEDTLLSLGAATFQSSAQRIDFGEVYVGRTSDRSFELVNDGDAPRRIEVFALQGDAAFALLDATPFSLPARSRHALQLAYAPAVEGAQTSTLAITSEGTTLTVLLAGRGIPVPSCDDHNPCTEDVFDFTTAACVHSARTGSCDDANACTTGDVCAEGLCVGRGITCDDGIGCTRDVCDAATGCTVIADDSACADTDPCTIDRCTTGGCTNDSAPDGYTCGPIVSCRTANICILEQCIEVDIPEGAPCDDGSECTAADECTSGVCRGTPTGAAPELIAKAFTIEAPLSGTFAGDRVYTSVAVGLREKVIDVELAGGLAAPISDSPALDFELRGSAGATDLVAIGPSMFARARSSTTGATTFEVIDASQPRALTVVASLALPASAGAVAAKAIAFTDAQVSFCTTTGTFALISVADPLQPATISFPESFVCRAGFTGLAARGAFWVSWKNVPGDSTYVVSRVDANGVTNGIDHSFATDGVHHYGAITDVHLDGSRLVIGVENRTYFYTADLDNDPRMFNLLALSIPRPARLLAVEARIAYFEANNEVRAYDFTAADAPVELPFRAMLPMSEPQTFASSADWLGLRGPFGQVAFISLASGAVSDVRAQGRVYQVAPGSGGIVAVAPRSVMLFGEPHLFSPSVATAPVFTALVVDTPALLDGPGGPLGIYAPVWPDQTQPTVRTLEVFTASVVPGSVRAEWPGLQLHALDGEKCTVAATSHDRLYTFDRCMNGVSARGEVAMPIDAAQVIVHEGALTASAYDGDNEVTIDLTIPAVTGARPFNFLGTVLAVRGPLVFVAGSELGRELLIFDTTTETPRLLHEVALPNIPMDLVLRGDRAFAAHQDGLSVLSPICEDR